MKTILLISFLLFLGYLGSIGQTKHTIGISGFTFDPAELIISVGDTVQFNGSSDHPVLQVNADTWNSNGDTPLVGGFSFPSGTGLKVFNNEGTYYYICENHVSSGMKGKITVSTTTNINEPNISREISIFPNPLDKENLSISYPDIINSEIEIYIYDLTGKVRIAKTEEASNGKMNIDCSVLIPGIYIVQVKADKRITSSKLVKK